MTSLRGVNSSTICGLVFHRYHAVIEGRLFKEVLLHAVSALFVDNSVPMLIRFHYFVRY